MVIDKKTIDFYNSKASEYSSWSSAHKKNVELEYVQNINHTIYLVPEQ